MSGEDWERGYTLGWWWGNAEPLGLCMVGRWTVHHQLQQLDGRTSYHLPSMPNTWRKKSFNILLLSSWCLIEVDSTNLRTGFSRSQGSDVVTTGDSPVIYIGWLSNVPGAQVVGPTWSIWRNPFPSLLSPTFLEFHISLGLCTHSNGLDCWINWTLIRMDCTPINLWGLDGDDMV